MSIFPLPVFETEADPRHRTALSDAEIYARLEPPKTIVVKFGFMKLVGEFSYDGDAKPGCGSKLVARTIRGTEVVEMLTTTCANSGCSKSVSRQEMLEYIENSGGKDFPFHTKGRILRVATIDDLNRQSELQTDKTSYVRFAKAQIAELKLPMKLVDVEPILGGELLTFYYMSEERIDFRELVTRLSAEYTTRIEMRQVGARDEARLVADYERCGQHCCCKNFLKVLKPISMRAAKVQKATLDPLKISGRCGRLMCCLRYEDQTYTELKKNLPPRNKRVGTREGPGLVVDSKILVQLVLVRLEHDQREIAVPVEELMDPDTCPKPGEAVRFPGATEVHESDPLRGMPAERLGRRLEHPKRGGPTSPRPPKPRDAVQPAPMDAPVEPGAAPSGEQQTQPPSREGRGKRRRRRDRRRSKEQQQDAFRAQSQALEPGEGGEDTPSMIAPTSPDEVVMDPNPQGQPGGQRNPNRKRRRRRRRRRGGDGGNQDSGSTPPGGSGDGGSD